MVVVGHPERHHLYEVAHAYLEAQALQSFVTTRFIGNRAARVGRALLTQTSPRVRRALASSHEGLAPYVLVACPNVWLRGLMRAGGIRTTSKEWIEAVVEQAERADVVHLPCVFALEVFERLKGRGKRLILEQYVGDRRLGRQAIESEAKALGMHTALGGKTARGYDDELIERNEREYALADAIVVGSRFVAGTLEQAGVARDKLVLAEYGCDPEAWPYASSQRRRDQWLDVAVVGSDSVRKGTVRTLMAARLATHVRVHVFGECLDLPGGTAAWSDVGVFHGHVPRADLPALLERCHAFCLPSVWEGSAYATGEAMATGLPAIVTPNAGSWVRDGVDGFVVPVGDVEAIARALTRLQDEVARAHMGREARRNAEAHTWAAYRAAIRYACLPA